MTEVEPPAWVLVVRAALKGPWHVVHRDIEPVSGPYRGICGVRTLPVRHNAQIAPTGGSGVLELNGFRLCNACAGRLVLDAGEIYVAQGPVPVQAATIKLELTPQEAEAVMAALYVQNKAVQDLIFKSNEMMLVHTIGKLVAEHNRLLEIRRRLDERMADGRVQDVRTEE